MGVIEDLNNLIEQLEPEILPEASTKTHKVFGCNINCGHTLHGCRIVVGDTAYRPDYCPYGGHRIDYCEIVDKNSPDPYDPFDIWDWNTSH